ncbi:S1C family serine protease [Alicyclobacillus sp. SO9]|uniref:S1C family serine protease n=1 Tax=Alicyclobacillus sp. SO9 TaxID=2665646 RepID=UPI0018E7504E|nr:trypsin-like peptidase domain-containing protein [Alicyclobacillus sp. SO9]QQE80259.1 trypsin-like peptidase domain-containing protein [Alicyclobacillus sp. SO9]
MASRWNDDFDNWSSGRRRSQLWVVVVVVGVVLYIAGVFSGMWIRPQSVQTAPAPANATQDNSQNAGGQLPAGGVSSNVVTRVYKASLPSIVTITSIPPNSKNGSQADIGTGFLVDTKGDIVTNNHVVAGQPTVQVTTGGHTYKGSVVGTDPLDDLAVVRVAELVGKKPLPLGSAKHLVPGQTVVAIGNPFALTGSVSSGIVSGLNRSMPTKSGRVMSGLVQTDAVLNPGNSGGPLLNSKGQVVGINTAIESPIEGSVGIGFAIPIDRFRSVMPKLVAGKTIQHPYLGISALPIDPVIQQKYQLPVSEGVLVISVKKGGPAAKAGIRGDTGTTKKIKGDGDVITQINGKPVTSVASLTAAISDYSVGSKVTVTLLRHGKTMHVQVVLGKWPKSLS